MAFVSGIQFENYKSLGKVVISPIEKINLLIGRKNSGKSTVLRMINALPTVDGDNSRLQYGRLPEQAVPQEQNPQAVITTTLTDECRNGLTCHHR